MLARENPHCGVSGVPFMNRTTGAEPTALSIAVRISSERRRICVEVRKRGVVAEARGRVARVAALKAWEGISRVERIAEGSRSRTDGTARLENIVIVVEVEAEGRFGGGG
jgi:hypothetical protein